MCSSVRREKHLHPDPLGRASVGAALQISSWHLTPHRGRCTQAHDAGCLVSTNSAACTGIGDHTRRALASIGWINLVIVHMQPQQMCECSCDRGKVRLLNLRLWSWLSSDKRVRVLQWPSVTCAHNIVT